MTVLYWLLGFRDPGTIGRVVDWAWHTADSPGVLLLAGIALVAVLVAALNLLPHNVMPWQTRLSLTVLRLVGFGIVVLMLAQVELGLLVERRAKPRVALLTDTSGSMGLRDVGGPETSSMQKSPARLDAARQFVLEELAPLTEEAELVRYGFDWNLEAQTESDQAEAQPGGMTRLIDAVREVSRRESDLQAVVLLSDGNDTRGDSGELLAPLLASRGLPVHAVVFGKSEALSVARVKVTEGASYVRLGDELRLTATITTEELGEQAVEVQLMQEGSDEPIAARQNVRIGAEPTDVSFVVRPDRPGPRTYRVVMRGVQGSASEGTLVSRHRVEVIDSKIRVLYLDIPRDERKIVGHWLARDPVVDLAALTMMPEGGWYGQGALQHKNTGDGLPDREADLYKYDVIILGDIPRGYFRSGGDVAETKMQRLVEFVSRRGGGLITLGGRDVYAAGGYQDSALARLLPFRIEATEEPQLPGKFHLAPTKLGLSHPVMSLERDPEKNRNAWFDLATLDGCNHVGEVKAGANLLATRAMTEEEGGGSIPVIAIQNFGKGKVLSLSADTTWRWEMIRPLESEDYFRRFWGNAVRFVAPDPRLSPHRPRVRRYQSETAVGETVTLASRLVNDVFEPVRDADLEVEVLSPSGKMTRIYPRDGRRRPGLYEYDVRLDESGTWEVSTTYEGETSIERITAGDSSDELDDPRSRPEAMRRFARATGGEMFRPGQEDELLAALDLRPRLYQQRKVTDLWNLPLTLVLLIGVVCADCFIRKRRGMV